MELRKITALTQSRLAVAPAEAAKRGAADPSASPVAIAAWYWNRLRCMSLPEVAYRVARKLTGRARRLGVATAQEVPAPNLARPSHPFLAFDPRVAAERYFAAADRILGGRFAVFDRECAYPQLPRWNVDPKTGRAAPLVFGESLDYRDSATVGDIKYLWEINRHLELVTLAQAYRLGGDARYLAALQRLLASWLDQCPYLLGANWSSALEVAIRLINWSAAWQLIGGAESPLFRQREAAAFRERWLASVYQHMHYIAGHFSRFSSANNHLIGEAAGLYIGATTWPLWPATRGWRRKARLELLRQALRQNAADGVNREQAVCYQQFVLSFLILGGLAGRANGDDFPVAYWQRIERMLEFIAAIMDRGGNVPMFGDADDGAVLRLSQEPHFCAYRSLLATGAVLFARGDFKAKAGTFDEQSRWLLGRTGADKWAALAEAAPAARLRRAFPEGGYYVLGCDFDTPEEIRVCADAGPLGYLSIAAHGHSDALAFTLSAGGIEFLIDPGTYAYHTERRWRDYFRSTAAHNTLRVDGENQSLIGGSFMWTRHARCRVAAWESDDAADRLVAAHDGYARLADPTHHERALIFDKRARRLHVSDRLECAGRHRVECFWHFAEDVRVSLDARGEVTAEKGGWRVQLRPRYPVRLRVALLRGDAEAPGGWVSRRFAVKVPTTTVVWTAEIDGATRLDAVIECVRERRDAAQ